jgi:hypothetical protein
VTLIVTGFQVSRLLHRQEDASTMDANDRISNSFKTIATWLERILALVILGGVAVFGLSSAQTLLAMSWGQTDTFYELIYRVLLLVIAIELVRTLVTHDLRAILELLAFVVARKMLKPDLNVIDIVLSVSGIRSPVGSQLLVALPFLASRERRVRCCAVNSEHCLRSKGLILVTKNGDEQTEDWRVRLPRCVRAQVPSRRHDR